VTRFRFITRFSRIFLFFFRYGIHSTVQKLGQTLLEKNLFLSRIHVNYIPMSRTNRRYLQPVRSSSHMRYNILVCINVFFFCNSFFSLYTNCIPEFFGPFRWPYSILHSALCSHSVMTMKCI